MTSSAAPAITDRAGAPFLTAPVQDAAFPEAPLSDAASVAADTGDRVAGQLGELAGLVADRDRMMGRVAVLLVDLQHADGLHDCLGGMTLQVWLEHVCRVRGAEARALLGAVDVLSRMPSVLVGLCDRWLSWSQVQAICRAARRAPVARLGELDGLVSGAMIDMATFEPDALVEDVWVWVDATRPSRLEQAERAAARSEFVSLSPKLFGGGSIYGELGPTGFATVAEAFDAVLPTHPATTPRVAGAGDTNDPDNPDSLDDDLDFADLDADSVDAMFDTLDDQRRAHTRDHGTRMARRLVDLCERALYRTLPPTSDGGQVSGSSGRARPMLLATIDADALLDATTTPGWLLHTLAGGRMKVSAQLLQQLVDERGADLRGIVLDDCGQVIGVGHKTDVPPHWLRQAIWARDLAARDPDGACPVRRTDLDHIVEWPDGATEVTNLHPLGRRWHNLKTSKTWTVTRRDDGATQWRHRRHGWTLRLAPARRSLTDPPPDPARDTLPDTHPPPQPARPNQLALTGVD